MTSSTSERSARNPGSKYWRRAGVYLLVTLFCAAVFLIYDQFSHNVRSPYMTYLFLWPLFLGVFPETVLGLVPQIRRPGVLASNLWHSGAAAVTVSSLLRGIFEIAGTSSVYQSYLMTAGVVFLALGILAWMLQRGGDFLPEKQNG